jgi:hypothetical protein
MESDTMPALELRINALTVSQSSVPDRRGGLRDDAFLWHGITDVRWDGKELPIRIEARSAQADRAHAARERWACLLNSAAKKRAQRGTLCGFDRNDVTSDILKRLSTKATTLSATVSKSILLQLGEYYELDQLARRSFKYAIRRVRAFAKSPPMAGSTTSDAYGMLSFIEQSLEAGDQGNLYGWNDEKLSGIRTYMQELTTRKNRHHPGYVHARDYILSNTSCFSPPDAWIRHPPTINADILDKPGL